ncbi:MAG: 3-dehydroquinate synthase [Gammaproteobacteria bacterium]|nr:3-dehydroquinate synthase [Gammaproteobacteria bacterium]MCZ6773858.1 3-dehydroquinate synthase [Pseudomonadota bacterium]
MNPELHVELGDRSYPIHIGPGLLADEELFRAAVPSDQVMILTDENVAPLYLDRIRRHFQDRSCEALILPDGEIHKSLGRFEDIVTFMLEHGFERSASLVALGGGVIGDLGGFAAACYQRGIAYVQVPTTLLAQVDSSVGGKTAVNHPLGKNMVGAFHQPQAVIADTESLATLPDREYRSGIAEVIKYGLIRDRNFFEWLEANLGGILARSPEIIDHAIRRSCENKAEIVAADETETGIRAMLNFGHTFGHAIETGTGYGRWLHGEAVAAGMCMAARLSALSGSLDVNDVARIESLIRSAGLPTTAPQEISCEVFLELMKRDKKSIKGRIRLVLLEAIGEAKLTTDYSDKMLLDTIASRMVG